MARATAPPPTNRRRPEGGGGSGDGQPQRVMPFVQAARKQIEGPFYDEQTALSTSTRSRGPEAIPPLGFLRMVPFLVELTGGSAGGATVATQPDAPWSAIDNVRVTDKNGADLFGPLSGFESYLADKYGALTRTDPRQRWQFSDLDADGNGSFLLYLPVEISPRDGFGALANMSAAQTYQLRYTVASSDAIYSTPPDTLPTMRVRAWVDAWGKPDENGPYGPQATFPPRHGATGFWTEAADNFASGEQRFRQRRTGNLIRCLVLVARNQSNDARDESVLPPDFRLEYDANLIEEDTVAGLRERMVDAYGFINGLDAAGGLDTGVVVWPYHVDLDGRAGWERRDHYLPTGGETRLDIRGDWQGSARAVLLTNDVAIPATSREG